MDIPGILALSIPIVAIVTSGVTLLVRMVIRHRERMAMIEMGMHPDYPPLEDEETGELKTPDIARASPQALRSVGEPQARTAAVRDK